MPNPTDRIPAPRCRACKRFVRRGAAVCASCDIAALRVHVSPLAMRRVHCARILGHLPEVDAPAYLTAKRWSLRAFVALTVLLLACVGGGL